MGVSLGAEHLRTLIETLNRYRWTFEKGDESESAYFEGIHLNLLLEEAVDELGNYERLLNADSETRALIRGGLTES